MAVHPVHPVTPEPPADDDVDARRVQVIVCLTYAGAFAGSLTLWALVG